MHVLAPWYTTDPGSIQHAEAIIVTKQQAKKTAKPKRSAKKSSPKKSTPKKKPTLKKIPKQLNPISKVKAREKANAAASEALLSMILDPATTEESLFEQEDSRSSHTVEEASVTTSKDEISSLAEQNEDNDSCAVEGNASEMSSSKSVAEQNEDNDSCAVQVNASEMSSTELGTSQLLSQTQEVLEGVSPGSPHFRPTFQLAEEPNYSQHFNEEVFPNQQHQQLGIPIRPNLPRRYSSPVSTGHDHFVRPPMTRSLSDELSYQMRRSFTGRLGSPCSGSEMDMFASSEGDCSSVFSSASAFKGRPNRAMSPGNYSWTSLSSALSYQDTKKLLIENGFGTTSFPGSSTKGICNGGDSRSSPGMSPDMLFMYRNWIYPLEQKLARIETALTAHLKVTPDPVSPPPPGPSDFEPVLKPETDQPIEDTSTGTYLGYFKHPKFRVWIPSLREPIVKTIEHTTSDPVELAKKLFIEIFKKELESQPDAICCSGTGEGRELLNQEYLRGIRLHVHKKYPECGKYGSKAEEERWVKNIRKKLNSHIRYRRRISKAQ